MFALWKILSRVQKEFMQPAGGWSICCLPYKYIHQESFTSAESYEGMPSTKEHVGKPLQKLHAVTSPSQAAFLTPLYKSRDP